MAEPGDDIVLEAGRFDLSDGLRLDVDGVTIRGAGMDAQRAGFHRSARTRGRVCWSLPTASPCAISRSKTPKATESSPRARTTSSITESASPGPAGLHASNGAYGIYPVESTNVLIDGVKVSGASDAGIYVGQSRANHRPQFDCRSECRRDRDREQPRCAVEDNVATRNTGGILVFDLPDLPVMGGGNVILRQ